MASDDEPEEKQYDTDAVSLTSSLEGPEPEEEREYYVDRVLAEDQNGHFLIKWLDYRWEMCTWEPRENLGEDTYQGWLKDKNSFSSPEDLEAYMNENIAKFDRIKDSALKVAEKNKQLRQQKRAKRKKKISQVQIVDDSSDSEPDVPLARLSRKRGHVDGFLDRAQRAKKRAQKENTQGLFVAESSASSSDGSEEPLMVQARLTRSAARKEPLPTKVSTGTYVSRAGEQVGQVAPAKRPSIKREHSERTISRIASTSNTSGPSSGGAIVSKQSLATSTEAPANRNFTTSKRSAPTPGPSGPIPIVNRPTGRLRKEWNQPNKLYGTLMYRGNAQKRSTRESVPDINALEFVNGTPRGLPIARPAAPVQAHTDDIYGRREFGHRREDRSDTPEEPAPNTAKIPLSCFEYRNGQCERGAQCRFLHEIREGLQISPPDGSVPAKYKTPPITCNSYMYDRSGCRNSDEVCLFAHHNTGLVGQFDGKQPLRIDTSIRPISERQPDLQPSKGKSALTCFYYMMEPKGCKKGEAQCDFAHRNTGLLKTKKGPPQKIDINMVPVSERSRGTAPKHQNPPITCFDYMNKRTGCRFIDEECDYAHYNTGWIEGKDGPPAQEIDINILPASQQASRTQPKHRNPPITCFDYMNTRTGCRFIDEECDYAHYNTGWIEGEDGPPAQEVDINILPASQQTNRTQPKHRNPPLTCFFYMKGQQGCKTKPCRYAHYNTGWLGCLGKRGAQEIDKKRLPVHGNTGRTLKEISANYIPFGNHNVHESSPNTPSLDEPDPSLQQGQISTPWTEDGTVHHTELQEHNLGVSSTYDLWSGRPNLGGDGNESPQAPSTTQNPRQSATAELKSTIEDACPLNFEKLFAGIIETTPPSYYERRAFLLFDRRHHARELEIVERQLLMHHVEVFDINLWGAWDSYKQKILEGGSGIIIAHPSFEYFWNIPDFGQVLRRDVRIWSVGVQPSVYYNPRVATTASLPKACYDCIDIFPLGGWIYITDEVFEQDPIQALEIITLFVDKCNTIKGGANPGRVRDDERLLWRLAVGPDLLQWTYNWCMDHLADLEDPDHAAPRRILAQSRAKLYELLVKYPYIDNGQNPKNPDLRPDDSWPIMWDETAADEEWLKALHTSQEEAKEFWVSWYCHALVERRRRYRQFFVVHTEPEKVDWQSRFQNISEIMTPAKCIEYFKNPIKGDSFDFFEWVP